MRDTAFPAIEIRAAGGPLLQVWRSGKIVWSEDTLRGDAPLRTAMIEPEAVAGAIAAIRDSATLGGRWTGDTRTGPGADATTVQVWDGDTLIVDVGSWHERFEADPRLVATASGIEPLGGRTRESVLAAQPGEYLVFRRRWTEVVDRLRKLVPGGGPEHSETAQ